MREEHEPYEDLANAIVKQAIDDYKRDLHLLERNPKDREAKSEASRLEKFFHSEWYGALTNLDPDQLLAGVKILVKKESVERRGMAIEQHVKDCLKKVGGILSKLETEDLAQEEGAKLKELCLEAINCSEELQAVRGAADKLNAQAIRRVGLQVKG